MKLIKTYLTRLKAEADASKLMENSIPSTIVGHDHTPNILSEFPNDPIELLVPTQEFKRAEMILKNNDHIIIKMFKILTYKSYIYKELQEERKQARLKKRNMP